MLYCRQPHLISSECYLYPATGEYLYAWLAAEDWYECVWLREGIGRPESMAMSCKVSHRKSYRRMEYVFTRRLHDWLSLQLQK